jgi:thymidylate synthase ThyX
MAYSARVLLDSISEAGVRLTTLEVTFPRFILPEFNTHRNFSRNSASSRAIPTAKLIERALESPATPWEWGRNKAGMSADDNIAEEDATRAKAIWLEARDHAVETARKLQALNVHKQILNRILEPFLWHTVIVTATEWRNFFDLRCAPNAQPEIRQAALAMRAAIDESVPTAVRTSEWHLPLIQEDERAMDIETRKKLAAARCARVSYLTHDGTRDPAKDIELYDRLKADRHLSPFEHVATPANDADFHANFRGWIQLRATIEREPQPVAR